MTGSMQIVPFLYLNLTREGLSIHKFHLIFVTYENHWINFFLVRSLLYEFQVGFFTWVLLELNRLYPQIGKGGLEHEKKD